ncbi:2-amino-4-hydroxy-6-hydroxymethyldihydropteridine diphosphokinase [Imhoffiella purpurea]|uniref:2-amino-4-hydroxy-6- hydroxymethyldihydropteridine diphosphokinase n=1 Tax=Imhoffiella purpurea TaxID=1249627 RepID=UPI0005C170F3|nr:2-amino-4-hydroxy-6-hydroxymethyldihydropteridine diphosphokinase [Imhoffiella purpurea]
MTDQTQVFLAIGSNIAPERNIQQSLALLNTIPATRVRVCSSWYSTKAWGIEEQADFINLVVGLSTGLGPRELLIETQRIEARLGRVRHLRNGPRTIDLDILLFGDRVIEDPDLSIPHPGLTARDFMLTPLIEIAPETHHPLRGRRVDALTGEILHRQILGRISPGDRARAMDPRPDRP